ncbi:MAG TPA: TetR family transcriptional regulator [Rhizomicrobium sp.]|jgi:AcrR family transcriptional regulator|nr:TetR family transcriptional regulator [Rhizomicrobium sp.]
MRRKPTRRRDAASTRAAILASARKVFARSGHDGAGLREIASGAGVTAMLVSRYFGSKEKLFAEVVAATMAEPTILTPAILGSRTRGADIAAALVGLTGKGDTPLEGFQIMLRSASSKRAAEIGRRQIEKRYQMLLASALGGNLAAERAAVVFCLVAGVQVMRQMIGLSALAEAKPAVLAAILGPLFELLVAGG